jgi:fructose-1-phosphate kinase PfkB-like protein
MPGRAAVGFKHYQEVAPGIAQDRAEIVGLNVSLDTPAGEFENVLKTEETNLLKPNEREFK